MVAKGYQSVDVGQQAPDFTLTGTPHQAVTLSDVTRETGAVLIFFRLAFTGG